MPRTPVQAAAEGLPKQPTVTASSASGADWDAHRRMIAFCQDHEPGDDLEPFIEIVTLPALTLEGAMAKARVLRSFSADDLRKSDVALAMALSLAEDLRPPKKCFFQPPLQPIEGDRPREISEAYLQWLSMERRLIAYRLYPGTHGADEFVPHNTLAHHFHLPTDRPWRDLPLPSARAELVLTTVGVDLNSQRG